MKLWPKICCIAFLAFGNYAKAQVAPTTESHVPATVECYYRIKWGSAEEFLRLYNKNHAPLLEEMKKLGLIQSIRVEEPFTHMAGGPRWDLRVTIVYRDATAALPGPEFDKQWAIAKNHLYSDSKLFDSEEKARFSLLEEHWDVVVNEVAL
jgi:hypothetical protein